MRNVLFPIAPLGMRQKSSGFWSRNQINLPRVFCRSRWRSCPYSKKYRGLCFSTGAMKQGNGRFALLRCSTLAHPQLCDLYQVESKAIQSLRVTEIPSTHSDATFPRVPSDDDFAILSEIGIRRWPCRNMSLSERACLRGQFSISTPYVFSPNVISCRPNPRSAQTVNCSAFLGGLLCDLRGQPWRLTDQQ